MTKFDDIFIPILTLTFHPSQTDTFQIPLQLPLVIQDNDMTLVTNQSDKFLCGVFIKDIANDQIHYISVVPGIKHAVQQLVVGELDCLDAVPSLQGVHFQLVAEGDDIIQLVPGEDGNVLVVGDRVVVVVRGTGQHGLAPGDRGDVVVLHFGHGIYISFPVLSLFFGWSPMR